MAFSLRAGTHWCHDFPKLARESGFYFNIQRTPVRVDWNRLNTIDIDRLIRDRDFLMIDENVNNVVDYSLESLYDIKILDSNFVKIFRLAQLSIEYLLYCRQYLDQSVIILKDDLKSKLEENNKLKKDLNIAEESIKELREKSKEKYKLIEKKLSDSHGEIHKCPHCPKTFISSVFMSSHVTRRHSALSIAISPPMHEEYRAEAEKLHSEIKNLKERLNETERVIRSETGKFYESLESRDSKNYENESITKYREEINNLKSILFSEIRNLKRIERNSDFQEFEVSKGFNELIKQQENEIQRLREQLQKRLPDITSVQVKLEEQENFWESKIREIEGKHRADIEKLYLQIKANEEAAEEMKKEYMKRISEIEERPKSRKIVEKRISDEENIVEEIEFIKNRKIEEKSKTIEIIPFQNETSPRKWGFKPKNSGERIEIMPVDEKIQKHSDSPKILKKTGKIENLMDNFVEKSSEEEDFQSEEVSDSQTCLTQSESASEDESSEISEAEKIRTPEEIRADVREDFNQRLKDLGIDPDWQGIPLTTYRQLSTIITHHRSLKSKKYSKFEELRKKLLQQVLKKVPKKNPEIKSKKSPKLNKLMSNVKVKVKGLSLNPQNLLPQKLDTKFKELINSPRESINSPKKLILSPNIERYVSSPQRTIKTVDYSGDIKGLSHSYESIKDWSKNSPNKLIGPASTSTPETRDKLEEIVSAPSSPKSGRSVLKTTTTGSVGNLGKKRVLFDLHNVEDHGDSLRSEVSIAADKLEDLSDSGESNFSDKILDKPKFTAEVPVKFSQSEKIAEIARKIDLQLSAARQKPVGGIEAMFMRKFNDAEEEKEEKLKEKGEQREIKVPQPKPRISLNSVEFFGPKVENKEEELDFDIDELLRMD